MAIEDVYSIQGRGTVVTGRVERGRIKVGDPVEVCGLKPTLPTVVTGVEMFHKSMAEGQAGDNVGLLLRGVKREEVLRGQLVVKPKSVKVHHKFEANVYALTKDKGLSTSSIRVSLSELTTEEEINIFLKEIDNLYKEYESNGKI